MRRIKVPEGGCVVGLDLSLRAAAACAIPVDWDHDLTKIRMTKTGSKLGKESTPKERAERIAQISHDVVVFCLTARARHVGIEDYAYGAGGANAMQVVELTGVVKHEILDTLHFAATPIPASSARKVLLQRLPRLGSGKLKPWVVANVRRLGGPANMWTDDECDAFVIANTVLMHAGGTAMTFDGTTGPQRGAP